MATRIKLLRLQNNYTQEQVAQDIYVSRQSYSLYEREERYPNLEVLHSLARYYKVSIDYICGLTDIPELPRILVNEKNFTVACYNDIDPELKELICNQLNKIYLKTLI